MAKITYLCEGEGDNTARISIDGVYIDSPNFVSLVDSKIHAIQWNGSSGEIEYKDNTPNLKITDISPYNLEQKHADGKKAITDAEEKEDADATAKYTYSDKRALEYPVIAEQLDDIYHNGIDGWKSTIKAIKDKYQKE